MKIYKAACKCWFFEWGKIWFNLWHSDKCRCVACGKKVCKCDPTDWGG